MSLIRLIPHALLLVALTAARPGLAQDSDATAHVPPDAILALRVQVERLVEAPALEMAPIEIADAWCGETLGIELSAVEELIAVVGMPVGPPPPPVGAVVRFGADFDPADIDAEALGLKEVEGGEQDRVFLPANGAMPIVVHPVDARTAIIATPPMLDAMLADAAGTGPLSELMAANPINQAAAQLIVAIEPARPMLVAMSQQVGQQLPPPLQGLTAAPQLADAVVVTASVDDKTKATVSILATDEDAAAELGEAINAAIGFGHQMFVIQSNRAYAARGWWPTRSVITSRGWRRWSARSSRHSGRATAGSSRAKRGSRPPRPASCWACCCRRFNRRGKRRGGCKRPIT